MKKLLVLSLLFIIVGMAFSNSSVYAVNNKDWNLYFENVEVTEGSVPAVAEPTTTGTSTTEITYSVNLNVPGDFYEFTVDATNGGKLDAMVDDVNENVLTQEQQRYLSYSVTYNDGTKIKKYDRLNSGETKKFKVRLEYRTDIDAADLPKEESTIDLSLNAYYVQAEDDKPADNKPAENKTEPAKETNTNNVETKEKEEVKENDVWSFIKSPKTGDVIIGYFTVLFLAVVALIIAKKKSKNDKTKN